MHVLQSLRCLPLRCIVAGDFAMQFCLVRQRQRYRNRSKYDSSHTRHTILLHFLHSPTKSRAQGPILPLVIRPVLLAPVEDIHVLRVL